MKILDVRCRPPFKPYLETMYDPADTSRFSSFTFPMRFGIVKQPFSLFKNILLMDLALRRLLNQGWAAFSWMMKVCFHYMNSAKRTTFQC